MRSILQLIRQPLRTLAGILVVALAVSVLSVSVSQTLAAANTAEQLNETFLTVALPTTSMAESDLVWIEELKEEHPDIIEADACHGLASAYIPELTPDNYTQHLFMTDWLTQNAYYLPDPRASYSAAMLVITLQDWGEPENTYSFQLVNGTYVPYQETAAAQVELVGTVEQIIGLQEGYDDPTGYTIRMTLSLPDSGQWEEIQSQLVTGAQYLVYGMNYYDCDWGLRCSMAKLMTWREEPELLEWDMETYQVLQWKTDWPDSYVTKLNSNGETEYFVMQDGELVPFTPVRKPSKIKVKIGDLYHGMTGYELESFRAVTLTLTDLPTYNSSTAAITEEEYTQRYQTPTIIRLEGSAEDFLASEEGALWQKRLNDLTVNNNTFPVIGVDDLSYLAGFATGKAEITEGRAFTEEELSSGAKVCVLAKSLAEANGLSVGDTIDPQFYDFDPGDPYQDYISEGRSLHSGLVNPTAYYYRADTTPFAEDDGPYTIVGLYEQTAPWGDVDYDFYSFTPNTIFVPKASVPSAMDYSDYGMFRTLVIRSDSLHELQLLTVEDNKDNIFYYYDNGYSAVASTLDDYRQAAELLLPIGLVVYAIVILLFLFLFPGRQGKDLAMMSSFGAQHRRRVRHVVVSCLGIVIPGTAIGTGVGLLLWQRVSVELQTWVDTAVAVELDPLSLWAVAAVQVVVVALLAAVLAIPMSRRANLMKRK